MEAEHAHKGPISNLAAGFVVLAMIVAALAMWTVVPFGWLWIASQASDSQAPSTGPYMIVLFGVISSIVFLGWLLGRLNGLYIRITGTHTIVPMRPAWLKSMRDERPATHGPSVMETVIVISVILAVVTMTVWFFVLAGSPIPSQ
jgi:hypothetical protein